MSYQVIARKYRPQRFEGVVGQRLITETLKNAILHDRVANGYIFSGARGVGKATTEPHKLPTPIQSRCQHFAFRLLDYAEIYSELERISAAEKIRADEKALSAIAQAAEGSLRDALSILDQMIAACGDHLDDARVRQLLGVVPASFMRELVQAIHAGDGRQALEQVNRLAAEGYELGHFCGELTRYVRNLMIARSCGPESPLLQAPSDERAALGELAGLFSEEDLSRFFQILLRTEAELRYSLQPRFHLELGLMKLVHARKLESIEGLLTELRARGPSLAGSGPAAGAGSSATTKVPAERSGGAASAGSRTGGAQHPPGPAPVPAPVP